MHEELTSTDDPGGTDDRPPSLTRRQVLRRSAGTVGLAVGGAALGGTTSGQQGSLPRLHRDGNRIVDPCDRPVILRGVNLVDPLYASQRWRGKTITEMIAHATNDDWATDVLRLPMRPEYISAADGRSADDRSNGPSLAHGDPHGPLLPGQLSDDTILAYLRKFVDPAVEAARQAGVYLQLDYHREAPVFHQARYPEHQNILDGCTRSFPNDVGACGERGVLWHGADQVSELRGLAGTPTEAFYEDQSTCEALANELDTIWTNVADRYAGNEYRHVIFDLYSDPTGPYAGEWGSVTATPEAPVGVTNDVRAPSSRPFWRLFLERAAPWIETAYENAPGSLLTLGSPGWSQYTYWAREIQATDIVSSLPDLSSTVTYSFHRYSQEHLQPMGEVVGPAASAVPVFVNQFGWAVGGSVRQQVRFDGSTGSYPDGVERGNDWPPKSAKANQAADYEAFFEEYPVHPMAASFAHSVPPAFFAGESHEQLRSYDEAPGRWWREYLAAHAGVDDPTTPDADGDCSAPFPGATDPDGDGDFEDLTGNGAIDNQDVVTYFQSMGTADDPGPLARDLDRFDYTDNGAIDYQDLIQLFAEIGSGGA